LLSAPLPEPEPEWRRVTLDALAKFISNPARFFAEKRLGLRLPDEVETLEEREVFSLGGLDRYQLREAMLEQKLRGGRLKNSIALARAAGTLPAGVAGDAFFAQQRREAEIFYRRLQPFHPEAILPPEPFEISLGAFRVSGSFTRLTPDGQLFYRPGRIRAKDLLRAWLEHLLCQAGGKPGNMTLVGEDRIQQLLPVKNSQSVLTDLLEEYWAGLRQPLKFFPESSFAFAEREMELSRNPDGRKKSTSIECALAKWRGNDFSDIAGESADKHFALFFHDDSALDGEFEAVAQTIFAPLLGHITEVEA
jgi:exodeoxyribonuclease V gamma subunit